MNSLEKFVIKFDAQHIPVNFDKWIKLDTDKYKDDEFRLNDYKSVVIKSTDSNILFRVGGVKYVIKQNMVYFPFIPIYHDCIIKLSSKISVYVNNDKSESKFDLVHDQKVDLLSEPEPNIIGNELHKLMMELIKSKCYVGTIFLNLEIYYLDEDIIQDVEQGDEFCMCMHDGMIRTYLEKQICKNIDTPYNIEKFYYEYQTLSKELNVDDAKIIDSINLIDKYYQLEVIKIYKYIK